MSAAPSGAGPGVATAEPTAGGAGARARPVVTRRTSGHRVRLSLGLVVGALALLLVCGLSMAVGSNLLPLPTVIRVLLSPDDSFASSVVQSRIPRTVLGLLVGASLAVAGGLIQAITRNPLGDPGLLGVNAGASASVVTVLWLTGGALGGRGVWAALPGAVLAAVVVYVVGSGGRGPTPVRLILAGAATSAVLFAYVQAISLSNTEVFDSYRFWVIGSLAGRSAGIVGEILPFVAVGIVLALLSARSLNAVALGDEAATSLGGHPVRTKVVAGLAATLLCASATAAVGPIAFVGLAVPHIVRSFTGGDQRWLLPYCALLGPVMVLVADVVGRVAVRPGELMVGTVTAFIGAPFLVAAVRRRRSGL